MDRVKVFISHASADKDIAIAFSRFLDSLASNVDIFCSSITGNISIGDNFVNSIMEQLADSTVFIPLISEKYRKSKFCIMELGIAFSYLFEKHKNEKSKDEGKNYICPFVIPPTGCVEAVYDTPLRDYQVFALNDVDSIASFIEDLEKNRSVKLRTVIGQRCAAFVERLNELLVYSDSILSIASTLTFRAGNVSGAEDKYISHEQKGNEIIISYNMSPLSTESEYPEYIGLALIFPDRLDLCTMAEIYGDSQIAFNLLMESQLFNKIDIEIKHSDNNLILDRVTCPVRVGINPVSIKLSGLIKKGRKAMQNISEICFVLKPTYIDNPEGQFSLTDIDVHF